MAEDNSIRTLKGHTFIISSIKMSPDGSYIYSGARDSTIKVWDFERGLLIKTLKEHEDEIFSMDLSKDGKYLVSGDNGGLMVIWDIKEDKVIRKIKQENGIHCLKISSDQKFIVSTSSEFVNIWDFSSGRLMKNIEATGGFNEVLSLDISLDGELLATGGDNAEIKIWDVISSKLLQVFKGHEAQIYSLCFSPDADMIVSGADDHSIKVWNIIKEDIQWDIKKKGMSVNSVKISKDGNFIVSGDYNNEVNIIQISTGEIIRTLKGHEGPVWTVEISPNNKYIISGSEDEMIKIWEFNEAPEIDLESRSISLSKESIIRKTKKYIKKLPALYNEVSFAKIIKRTGITFQDLERLLEDMILEGKLRAKISGSQIIFDQAPSFSQKGTPSDKSYGLQVKRGGNWKIEGNHSTFFYKVKVENDSSLVIANIQIILTSIPKGLKAYNDRYKIDLLRPGAYESPSFKLQATESCVGDIIEGTVIYLDPSGTQKSILIEPFEICYVCNLLTPKEISKKEFDEKVEFMEDQKLMIESDLTVGELEARIASIVKNCNFALLKQLEENKSEDFTKIEAFAEGLYDKQDVALSIAIKEVKHAAKKGAKKGSKKGTKLVVKAMSERSEKLMDILKDLNVQLDDIKSDTELIKEYTSQIEEIFDKVEDLEDFLIQSLGSDFTKIKHAWQDFKAGKITKGGLIKEGLKIIGKKFVKKIIKKMII